MKSPIKTTSEALKKFNIPTGTLVMIVALCILGGVGFFAISQKEEYLVQRNFRLLKLWSQDISSKIESYQQVFRFSAKGIFEELHNKIEFTDRSDSSNRKRILTTYKSTSSLPVEGSDSSQKEKHDRILKEVSPWSCALRSKITTTFEPDVKNVKSKNGIINNLKDQLNGMCLDEGLTTIRLSISRENSSEAKPQAQEKNIAKTKKSDNPTEANTQAQEKDIANAEKFKLTVDHQHNRPIILLTYSQPMESNHGKEPNSETEIIKIVGEIDLRSFLTRLFQEPIFDEVLLFDSLLIEGNGNDNQNKIVFPVLFDSGSQEFTWTNFQNLIEKAVPSESFLNNLFSNPEDTTELRKELREQNSPKQFLINLPGKTNNVFTLPVLVSGNRNTPWRLVGMIDHNTFQNNYLAISSSLVQWVMFLLLGLLLCIPFLHLKTMGPKDPLRMSHILSVILAAFLGTGTLTFLVLDLAVHDEATFRLRQNIEGSAESMKQRVHEELLSVLFTLTQFDQSNLLKNDKKILDPVPPSETVKNDGERSVVLEVLDESSTQTLFKDRCDQNSKPQNQSCYPDFLNAFWMDADGSLRINWVQKKERGVSTNVSLKSREYVQNVLKKEPELWKISDNTNSEGYEFFLQPIISWSTGENTVVASMRSNAMTPTAEDIKSWVAPMKFAFSSTLEQLIPPPRIGFTITESSKPWVAAIEFKFISLMDQVVLPPGIGFAVIENDKHRVLFHSKEGRNLREDFLAETDQNQELRGLLAARTAGHVNGSYWGKDRSFYTLPLKPLPWTLVVYREREIFQSVSLFGLVIAGGLYSLWSLVIYLIAWVLLRRISKHRKAVCLWPNAAHHIRYVTLIMSNVVVFLVGLYFLKKLTGNPGGQLITALLLIPGASIILAFILVKIAPKKGVLSSPSLRNSYAYLATAFLLVFAVIPALACFTTVFHKEMTLLTQSQLLETYKSLENSGRQRSLSPESGVFTLKKVRLEEDCRSSSLQDSEPYKKNYGFYPNFFLNTGWSICKDGNPEKNPQYSKFDQFFAFVSQPFLPLLKNVSLWGFIEEPWLGDEKAPKNQRAIYWDINTPDTDKENFSVLLTDKQIKVSSPLPLQPWFLGYPLDLSSLTLGKKIKYGLIAGLFFLWIIIIPKFIATRTVYLNYPTPFKVPQNLLFNQPIKESPWSNQLILGFPGQAKSPNAVDHYIKMKQHYETEKKKSPEKKNETKESDGKQGENPSPFPHYFDMRAVSPQKWKEKLTKDISNLHHEGHHNLHVFIDHLERQWKEPAINLKKLELLEWLFNPTYQNLKLKMEVRTERTSQKKYKKRTK